MLRKLGDTVTQNDSINLVAMNKLIFVLKPIKVIDVVVISKEFRMHCEISYD